MTTTAPTHIVEIHNLKVEYPTRRGIAYAANDVELLLAPTKTLGLVGESGSGKSVTLRSVIRMVPKPGEILDGEILWNGDDMLGLTSNELREIRGREITMIFQDPGTSLNPVSS